ncbi:uncharacterized protein LOC116010906 [Ipomoea triloba]|uniref:uncharacterized protein LOC116010906 n=1 Tax=Ipomoea triloba TaxID=35885 RepID=UPI00125E68FF|nr:uncharacterized protein LOC116010906 [Ipomoea triloba]
MDLSAVQPIEITKPQFLTPEYATRWDSIDKRKILSERFLDVERFKAQCQLIPIFEKIKLMRSVINLKEYPPMAIKEFYANLMPTIKDTNSAQCGRVWLRNKYYNFTIGTINSYLGIDADDLEDPDIGVNVLTKVITGGTVSYWPTETNMLPAKSLTTKFAILHKIAMTNWMPNEHMGELSLLMATLIYKIGKGILVDLGHIIFKQVVSFRDPTAKESKVKLPFPCTIYGILRAQTFRPNTGKMMEKPKARLIDARLNQSLHVLDIHPEHGSSSTQPLSIKGSRTSQMTSQFLDKSIQDLNTIIQILEELAIAQAAMIETAEGYTPTTTAVAENIGTCQEAVSSKSE